MCPGGEREGDDDDDDDDTSNTNALGEEVAAFEHGVHSPLSVPLTHDGVSTMSDPSPSSLNAGPDPDGPDPDTWYIQTTLNGPEAGVRNIS